MEHAHHFLSRLDRLSTSEVDTALELYRDPDLLRAIMNFAKVPHLVPRVAISLGDPAQGPFIVVTRDGHFVTCLGRGMHAADLPIVTRGQLDTYAEKLESVRERLALARHFSGNRERPLLHLLRRLLARADCLSREEFLAVSAWEPILHSTFVDLYLGASKEILDITPVLCSVRRFHGKPAERALHAYWNVVHIAGHLILLATMGGDSKYVQAVTEEQPAARNALGWSLTQTGALPFLVRGAWAVGRLGRRLLATYKRSLNDDIGYLEFLDTLLGLVAIGRRNSGSRAEIIKALHAASTAARSPRAEELRQSMDGGLATACALASQAIECENETLESVLLSLGKSLIGDREVSAEVTQQVARVLPLLVYRDTLSDGKNLALSLALVAATARDAPECFYLPQAVASQCYKKWEPKFSLALIEPRRRQHRLRSTPAQRENKPERNQPCLCGSGKKYKKCCGSV